MFLYAALGLCAFLAAVLVYRYDLYEREPLPMLAVAAVAGAFVMRIAGAIEMAVLPSLVDTRAQAALAAFTEEGARIVVVLLIAFVFPRYFDEPVDGLVYGSIIGLGMAVEESWSILVQLGAPHLLALPVEVVRLLGHLVMGGIIGSGVAMWRFEVPQWRRSLARALAVALSMHFFWDWIALQSEDGASLSPAQTASAVGIMLFGLVFYGHLVVQGARLSKQASGRDTTRDLWGWPFTLFFRRRDEDEP